MNPLPTQTGPLLCQMWASMCKDRAAALHHLGYGGAGRRRSHGLRGQSRRRLSDRLGPRRVMSALCKRG